MKGKTGHSILVIGKPKTLEILGNPKERKEENYKF